MVEWKRFETSPFRAYEISDAGEVRRNGRVLKGCVDRNGYRSLLLYYSGLSKRFSVHRIVCETFNGPAPQNTECAHLDGVASNNHAVNLAWVTRSENTLHQYQHGTHNFIGLIGERHPRARLSDEVVASIRADAIGGMGGRKLSRKYGISRSHVFRITSGQQRPQGDAQTPDLSPTKGQGL